MSTNKTLLCVTLAGALASAVIPGVAEASSHREAPYLTEDPTVDATDLYLFRNGANVVMVANYIPMELPGGGPNFHRFSDNAVYRINIDNNGDAVADIVYEFRFTTSVRSGDTFLYNTGPIPAAAANLNVSQAMTVTRVTGGTSTVAGMGLAVAPAYVGRHSFTMPTVPATATGTAGDTAYDAYVAANNVHTLAGGGRVFAGPRDDPFFVDLGAVFDLLRVRPLLTAPGNVGQLGGGVDYVAGFNVHSIVLEVPITALTVGGATPTAVGEVNSVIGVWTTAHRPRVRVLRGSNNVEHHGQLVQVSRLGIPLVNEVLVPLGFKDFFNGSQPANDAANYGAALMNNEPTRLLNALYYTGLGIPADVAMVGGNLITLISGGLIRGMAPTGTLTPADILRLNLAQPGNPFPAAGTTPTLGAFAADVNGFPNGRRLADDVTDIELRVLAGALANRATSAPNNQLGDGVNANERPFSTTFPYLARPYEGYASPYVNGPTPASPAR